MRDAKNRQDLKSSLWVGQIMIENMSEPKEQPVVLPSLTSRLLFPLVKHTLKSTHDINEGNYFL